MMVFPIENEANNKSPKGNIMHRDKRSIGTVKSGQVDAGDGETVLTCEDHEDAGRGDVGRRATPAAADPGPERDEDERESQDEHGDHGTRHICNTKRGETVNTHFRLDRDPTCPLTLI